MEPLGSYCSFENLRACPCRNRPLNFCGKWTALIFHTTQATYAMNENRLHFDGFAFFIFWGFFCRYPENHTNRKFESPKFGGYDMRAQNSHIKWNNPLILFELLHNYFFFLKETLSAYLKHKQSYDFLTWSSKRRLCHFCL